MAQVLQEPNIHVLIWSEQAISLIVCGPQYQ